MLPVFQNLRWSIQGFVKGEELFSNCYLTSSEALFTFISPRDVSIEFHLKFWNTNSIGIPVRSLL